jgi:hypothetical protein
MAAAQGRQEGQVLNVVSCDVARSVDLGRHVKVGCRATGAVLDAVLSTA